MSDKIIPALIENSVLSVDHINMIARLHKLAENDQLAEYAGIVLQKFPSVSVYNDDNELNTLLSLPIECFSFSVRTERSLKEGGISTLKQIIHLTDRELLRIHTFGKTSLREVKHKLNQLNLSLGTKATINE